MRGRAFDTKPSTIRAELIGSCCCSAAGMTAVARAPVLALCRKLVAAGVPPDWALQVYRGDRLALLIRSIGDAAKLTVRESTRDGRPRFVPLSSDGAAPMQKSGPAAVTDPTRVRLQSWRAGDRRRFFEESDR
jgi:hypothetical protein